MCLVIQASTDPRALAIIHLIFSGHLIFNPCPPPLPPAPRPCPPPSWSQDDDTNYHMDMIAGLANMRARNYSIQEVRGGLWGGCLGGWHSLSDPPASLTGRQCRCTLTDATNEDVASVTLQWHCLPVCDQETASS